jgi:hypothetical protein
MTAAAPFAYSRTARSLTAGLVVAAVLLALLAAWLWLEAAPWIVAGLALFTLPALYDLAANPAAGLTLTDKDLSWHSGRRHAQVTLDEIDNLRLDTRLDFSVRASVVLRTGRKIRLPFEATPPHRAFEAALEARGVKVMRFHFQLMQ